MATNAVARDDRLPEDSLERKRYETQLPRRIGRVGLGTAGVIAVLVSAWGGIVPYVGPLFGYSGDGSGSWHWNLAHAALALAPGAAGVLLGLFVIAEAHGIAFGKGRMSLATAGMLLMVCGAWFAIGPLAWPVLDNASSYFAPSSHLRLLANEVGYSLGTGLVLVICGAFVDGWASRHQPRATLPRALPSMPQDQFSPASETEKVRL